ncbi:MAG: Uncharacterized protein LiPW15_520 [Parcubacteria group bacterium LiPW_15]|nr:MAG: Uncharacterized protein LiPW15_520 [Parcubacteria group bacterium LiPW_15]
MEKQTSFSKQEAKQKESLDPVLDSIMTAEEYSKVEHKTPYVFELKAGDRELYYFGSPHVSDSNDPVFAEIEAAFNKANPEIVFVEGLHVRGDINRFNERMKATSCEETIDKMGEPGFTVKLGLEKGAEWQSPEPTDDELYANLLARGFSKEEVFAWDVFHILPQYSRQMKREGFEGYVRRYIERFRETTKWENFDYSYANAMRLGEQILGRKIDVENESEPTNLIDPIPWEEKKGTQTILNRISESASLFRDRKIVSGIAEAFKSHKRVFVVYGSSHAAMQEPALRKLLEQK